MEFISWTLYFHFPASLTARLRTCLWARTACESQVMISLTQILRTLSEDGEREEQANSGRGCCPQKEKYLKTSKMFKQNHTWHQMLTDLPCSGKGNRWFFPEKHEHDRYHTLPVIQGRAFTACQPQWHSTSADSRALRISYNRYTPLPCTE